MISYHRKAVANPHGHHVFPHTIEIIPQEFPQLRSPCTCCFTESFYTYIHRYVKVHMTLKSLQLPQWLFCNRNNLPAKFPPPYLLEHLGIYFSDTAFCKKIKFFSLTWSKSCCFCLSAHLLLYWPSSLLWLPFVPDPSQPVSCFRWTWHMLPGSICQAFCTFLPFSALSIL